MTKTSRTFTFRAGVIGVASMVLLGLWMVFHKILAMHRSKLLEDSPPAGAVGVFLGVLGIATLVGALSRRLRLAKGELIVIYAMLVVCAPFLTQGMWQRFLGLVIAIPENQHNMALVDGYSDKLWPHGEQLIANGRFAGALGPAAAVAPPGRGRRVELPGPDGRVIWGVELTGPAEAGAAPAELRIRVGRRRGGRQVLVPGERYYLTALFRLTGLRSTSRLDVEIVSDRAQRVPVVSLQRDTGAWKRWGQPLVQLPRRLAEHVDVVFSLHGQGAAVVTDVKFFSNEAVARLRKGTESVRRSDLDKLPDAGRDALLVRPDDLATPAGAWYTLKGSIPYRQWAGPMFYWGSIVLAMFLGLLGIGVIFRRQWSENERFSYPLLALPRLYLETQEAGGTVRRALFHKASFRAGLVAALAYCLLLALHFYVPGMPDPKVRVALAKYFGSPAMQAFVNGYSSGYFGVFEVTVLLVAVAFFIDLDLLKSILLLVWLVKLPYAFGEVFGWKNIRGPLDSWPFAQEQHIGAFLSLALLVLWVARRHLAGVGRRVLGLRGGLDDAGEAMRYRTAVLLIAGSFAYFGIWGALTGMGVGSAMLFFGFLVVCGLSVSRIRTECGVPAAYFTPYYPFLIFALLGGLHRFSLETMILAYVAGGFMAVAQYLLFAPTQVEMLHLAHVEQAKVRHLPWALVLGAVGGVLIGGYVIMVWCYGRGGDSIPQMRVWGLHQDWYFTSLRKMAWARTAEEFACPTGPWYAVGVGAAVTLLLAFLRTRFVGFWLHPLGYVLANTYCAGMCWGSLLVAFVVKYVALKIGGPKLIREQMRPFFAGVFAGGVAGMVLVDLYGLLLTARGVRDVLTIFP